MENEQLRTINRNIEVVIGLLIRGLPSSEGVTLRDTIIMLKGLGMRPKDIARTLGKSDSHITKELSISGKTGKKKKRK